MKMKSQFRNIPLSTAVCLTLLQGTCQQGTRARQESFKAELFLNSDDLNAGLYEGEVRGRKRFGDTQVPHGVGTIYYFTTDKYNRVNYTGEWVGGEREGNGTTSFRDGAVYTGQYRSGLEHGQGFITYPNGNSLDAEFIAGKIMGHGVFRYASGDQREGFFRDNILEGQVIFTRSDGTTVIEKWSKGEKTEVNTGDKDTLISLDETSASGSVIRNLVMSNRDSPSTVIEARGGSRSGNLWRRVKEKSSLSTSGIKEHTQVVRTRARSILFDIYTNVN